MFYKNREQGGVGMIAIVMILGAVGIKLVSDKMAANNRLAESVQRDRQSMAAKSSNISALDYFSALLQYDNGQPALYASDYKANKWNLVRSPGSESNQWSIESNNLIRIQLPDVDGADFARVHDPNNFVEPKFRKTDIEILSLETSQEVPYVKKARMYVRTKTGFGDADSSVQKSIVGVINLPSPPQPTIQFYTRGITSSGHIGSGLYREINEPSIEVSSTTAGSSSLKIDIIVNGVASDGFYVFGDQKFPLNLANSKNHLSRVIAAQPELTISGHVAQAGSCSWTSMSEEYFRGISDDVLQEYAEWESISNARKVEEANNRVVEAEQQLTKTTEKLVSAYESFMRASASVTGKPMELIQDTAKALERVKQSADSKQALRSRDTADQKQRQIFNALAEQLQEIEADMTREDDDDDDDDKGKGGDSDKKKIEKLEERNEKIDNLSRYAVSAATDRANALQRLEEARDKAEGLGDSSTVDVSTQEYKLPDGIVFNLEVFVTDVDGNVIQRELTVHANSGPSDCGCGDVGLYSYSGQSRATISGDGGDICSNSTDLFSGQLYAVFGRKPSCITQAVQLGRQACGCFDSETLITMADGSTKKITAIKSGDMLLNPVTQSPVRVLYTVQGPENLPMLKIETDEGSVVVTSKHPFPTKRGYLPAYRLELGDKLMRDQTIVSVKNIEVLPASDRPPTVWNIMLAGDENPRNHMLLGNGLVTGDLFLQNKLERERKRDEWEVSELTMQEPQ
ncbi:MAG: hypothetical protein ACOH5I_22115 [Oligoflexus sp.]